MALKKIIMFTIGKAAEGLLTISALDRIEYFIDNDKNKINKLFHEKMIHAPKKLIEENKNNIMIIVGNDFYYKEISEQLNNMGFIEDIHFFNGYFLSEQYHKINQKRTWKDSEFNGILECKAWEDRIKIMVELIDKDVNSIRIEFLI